jgi:hypothetical protein
VATVTTEKPKGRIQVNNNLRILIVVDQAECFHRGTRANFSALLCWQIRRLAKVDNQWIATSAHGNRTIATR